MTSPRTDDFAAVEAPQDGYGAGYFERQLRNAMDDMRMFRSFDGLRELCAEILNEMAEGKRRNG